MQTSFPKDKIKVVLFEGIHAQGVDMLAREGFDVEHLRLDELDQQALAQGTRIEYRNKPLMPTCHGVRSPPRD